MSYHPAKSNKNHSNRPSKMLQVHRVERAGGANTDKEEGPKKKKEKKGGQKMISWMETLYIDTDIYKELLLKDLSECLLSVT